MKFKHALVAIFVTVVLALVFSFTRSGPDKLPTGTGAQRSAQTPTARDPMIGLKSGVTREAAIAMRKARIERYATTNSLPDVMYWDDKYPGFYDEFRPVVDVNPSIRKAARKCNLLHLVKGTTDVEYLIGLTFTQVADDTYAVTAVNFESEGELSDEYIECIRQSYVDADIKIKLTNGPEALRIKTAVRMYFKNEMTPAESHEFIAKLNDELAEVTDDNTRQIYVDLIDFFECVERVGRDNKKECL